MKKLLIAALALVMAPAMANADGIKGMTQSKINKKGKISLSGDLISFNNVKFDDGDAEPSSFSLAPVVGYNVIDNVQITVGLGFGSTTDGAEGDAESKTSFWTIAPGVRYTFDQLSKKNLFPSVGLSYAYGSGKNETGGIESEMSMTNLSAGAAITQALGGEQGGYVSLGINYEMQGMTPDGADEAIKSSGIDASVSFGLYF